jgi:hemerythrin-like domain-containing protein
MNTATKNLEEDHVYVLKLTAVMRIIAETKNPDVSSIESIVEIIKNFADGLHHAKEENVLFPALGRKGFSNRQGPVAVMLMEHVQGREFVKGMSENIELYKKGDKTVIDKVFLNMSWYANLLESHIAKENNILFRMADSKLSADEHAMLLKEFEIVERNRPEGTRFPDYAERIKNLENLYNV